MRQLRDRATAFNLLLALLLACLVVFDSAVAQSQPAAQAPAAGSPPSPPPATTQPPAVVVPPLEALEPVERLARNIESAEKAIQQLKELESDLVRLRVEVERIIYDSTATADSLRPQLDEVRKQIERLGPAPAKDQPPESPTVAAERARLAALQANLDGAIKTTELAWVRAKQLIDRITVIRYQLFTRNLLERKDSPLLPGVWRNVSSQLPSVIGRLQYYGGDWLTWAGRVSGSLWVLGLAIVFGFIVVKVLVERFLARHLVRREPSPTFIERTLKAAWMAPMRMLAPALAVVGTYFGLAGLDLLFSPWLGLASAAMVAMLVYVASTALLRVAFAPKHPGWRLVPVDDGTAWRVLLILESFVGVYLIDIVLVEILRVVYAPLAMTITQTFISSMVFAGLAALLFLTPLRPQTGPDRPFNGHAFVPRPVSLLTPLWIKLPLLAIVVLIVAAALAGYIALARFVAHQVVLSGTVLAGFGLLYLAVRSATRGRSDNRDLVSASLETRFGITDGIRRRQISRLVEATATLGLGLLALPLLMVQWGFSAADIRDWGMALLFGFEIGQFRISLARILIGIGLFTGLLFLTRLVQRWLRDSVMNQGRVDAGISHSIDTAVGYAGIGLAALIALSYAGLDITSLAIVAGALSVGIGFGLQSIVNNFVSGLILLVERPIKVGDWIVVGSEQGNVRRISVRSTEIETFDKASVIVPNSELITGRVLNWTHRNPLGRAVVKVEVAPSADPELVLQILRECTAANELALKTPAPFITFDGFSSEKLEFTARVIVGDVYSGGSVATQLRIAILKRLREENIQMARTEYDIHLRDLEWIKATAARVAADRSPRPVTPAPAAAAAPGPAEAPQGSNDNA